MHQVEEQFFSAFTFPFHILVSSILTPGIKLTILFFRQVLTVNILLLLDALFIFGKKLSIPQVFSPVAQVNRGCMHVCYTNEQVIALLSF